MSNWNVEPGEVNEILGRALKLINDEDTRILEARLEKEMLNIYEEPGIVVETRPSGVMRLTVRFIGPGGRRNQGKGGMNG